MEAPKKVNWSARSLKQFEKIYQYVFEESEQNAESLRVDIFAKTAKLSIYPDISLLKNIKKTMMEPTAISKNIGSALVIG